MMELVDPDRSWLLEVEDKEAMCWGAVPMVPVESSSIAQVGYCDGHLLIEFIGGRVYVYDDVEVDVYEGLVSAPSAGRYFTEVVRNHYEYERLA